MGRGGGGGPQNAIPRLAADQQFDKIRRVFLRDRVIAADAAPDPRVKEGNGIRAKAAQYLSYLWILPSSSLGHLNHGVETAPPGT